MTNRSIDNEHPDGAEQQHRRESHTFSKASDNKRRRYNGKGHLEHGEQWGGNRAINTVDRHSRKHNVTEVTDEVAMIATKDALNKSDRFEGLIKQSISLEEVKWARKWLPGERKGPQVKSVAEVLTQGDIIAVETIEVETPTVGTPFGLRQIPDINGSLVALDPHTGRVLAMVGGFDFTRSTISVC